MPNHNYTYIHICILLVIRVHPSNNYHFTESPLLLLFCYMLDE